MGNFIDLTGQKFGKLTVIRKAENPSEAHIKWLCKCECGNFITIIVQYIVFKLQINHFLSANKMQVLRLL